MASHGAPATPTIPARHALVVADGDVAPRQALDAAWPGWDADIADVLAADGGLARARILGVSPDVLIGDLDSLKPALAAGAGAAGIEVLRAPIGKDESDTELALLEAVRRGATRVTVLGAFGGPRLDHALANLWLLAHPGLAGVAVVLLDARSRASLVTAPGPDGLPVRHPLPGPPGATVSLLPLGGDVTGITTAGLRYPLRDEPLRTGPARGLSNVRTGADSAVTVRAGRLLVVETALGPGGLSSTSMSMPQAGDLAPEVALPDEHGVIHRLADRRGSWTVVYFYPRDDSPGCTTEACGFRDVNAELEGLDARIWGVSPDGAGSHAAFRAKFGLPFTLLSDVDHAAAEAFGAWGEKTNHGNTYMGIIRSSFLVDPDGRVARAWPSVKADGHAEQVLEALRAGRSARSA